MSRDREPVSKHWMHNPMPFTLHTAFLFPYSSVRQSGTAPPGSEPLMNVSLSLWIHARQYTQVIFPYTCIYHWDTAGRTKCRARRTQKEEKKKKKKQKRKKRKRKIASNEKEREHDPPPLPPLTFLLFSPPPLPLLLLLLTSSSPHNTQCAFIVGFTARKGC